MLENIDWDERYKGDAEGRPWDTGSPAPELVEYFEHLDSPPAHVFEIGCGTGTNAIWMSKKGSSVVATDISPTAIDAALKKAKEASIEIDFKVSDILEESPAQNESIDFVFDRGVFHVIEPESRNKFARRVADLLVSQGHWLCLVGNADEIRGPEVIGPPQLTASELVGALEDRFELHKLERTSFVLADHTSRLAWKLLLRKRKPASD